MSFSKKPVVPPVKKLPTSDSSLESTIYATASRRSPASRRMLRPFLVSRL